MKTIKIFLFAFHFLLITAAAQNTNSHPGNWRSWGDLGNGTYKNPILPADYSDLDAIRVGDDYYAISSTMQFSPGMVVLHSKDLVNWEIIGHVVDDLTRISPQLNWDRMNSYGKGVNSDHVDPSFWDVDPPAKQAIRVRA